MAVNFDNDRNHILIKYQSIISIRFILKELPKLMYISRQHMLDSIL